MGGDTGTLQNRASLSPQVTQLAVILLEEALARAITIVLIPDLHEQESHNRDTD